MQDACSPARRSLPGVELNQGPAWVSKFTEMLLEGYDIALKQLLLGARGLFPVAAPAPAHQIIRVVGFGGIREPPSREDVVDTEFAAVLHLGLPAIPTPVIVAGSNPFRPVFPVRRERQEWLITILRMSNAGEVARTSCV